MKIYTPVHDSAMVLFTDSRLLIVFTFARGPGVRKMSAQIVPLFLYFEFYP